MVEKVAGWQGDRQSVRVARWQDDKVVEWWEGWQGIRVMGKVAGREIGQQEG